MPLLPWVKARDKSRHVQFKTLSLLGWQRDRKPVEMADIFMATNK